LIREVVLFVFGESASYFGALYRQPLRVLPRFQFLVKWHVAKVWKSRKGAASFSREPHPYHAYLFSTSLFSPVRLYV
jgi:hypothetical protein